MRETGRMALAVKEGHMAYQQHLYHILYPGQALVASSLHAEAFGKHYQIGSHRHYEGKVIFCEIDPAFRHSYFDIDGAMAQLTPHEDGRPKATKYISSYRVLEHLDFDAVGDLYLLTATGGCLRLGRQPYDKSHEPGHLRCFAQISPLNMLVLSTLCAEDYATYITRPHHALGAPKLFFTQIELPTGDFLKAFEDNPFTPPPLPFVHPAKLRDAIMEMKADNSDKKVKGVSIRSDLEKISFSRIRHGFWLASPGATVYFPMPDPVTLMRDNYQFYKSL